MALFGRKKKSGSGIITEDEILGFLDELVRNRIPLTIMTKYEDLRSNLYEIDEDTNMLKIQGDPALDEYEGKEITCGFPLDRTFYTFTTKLVDQNGRPYLELPDEIVRKERRKSPRISFSTRQRIKVAGLQGLGSGVGVTGFATDVSTGGISLAIERAMIMQNEREVTPNYQLLEKGTELVIVKINRLPGLPAFEVSGVVNRIFRDGGDWKLAIELPKIPGKFSVAIKRLIESKTPQVSPKRRSRKRRMEMEALRRKEEEEARKAAGKEAEKEPPPEAKEEEEFSPAPVKQKSVEDIFAAPPGTATSTTAPSSPSQQKDEALSPPEIEPVVSPEPETETEPEPIVETMISLGQELDGYIGFLETDCPLKWIHVNNPMRIVKNLNEQNPKYLLLPWKFKQKSMLDYLKKIDSMGVLKGVEVIILSEEEIPMRELVKSKMLGIKHILTLPLESPSQLLDLLK